MAKQLFANNATSMLSGILTQGGNVLVCSTGEGNRFPSPAADEYFLLTIYTKDAYANEQKVEVVKVTSRAGDTLMLERDVELLTGQSGGYAYNGNTEQVYLELRWTAGGAGNVLQASDNLASLVSFLDARTNLGLGNVNNTADLDKPISSATQAALNGKADTGHTHEGFVSSTDPRLSDARPASDVSAWAKAATKPSYTKTDVGLGNVDNTSDLGKPISSATQTALNAKQDSLVSGTSIKTLNSVSLLGSGDITTVQLGTSIGAALASSGSAGTATTAAKSDHVHPFPTAANVGAEPTITTLSTSKGGTGQNSSAWTGLVKANAGTWSTAVAGTDYQAPLVSGTNIKTINGGSLLGAGDLAIGGGGAVEFISTITANNNVSIEFTGLSSAYINYLIVGNNLGTGSGFTDISAILQNTAYGWVSGTYSGKSILTDASSLSSTSTTQLKIIASGSYGLNASMHLYIYNPSNTTKYKGIRWHVCNYAGDSFEQAIGGGYKHDGVSAVTGIRLSFSNTLTSGTFSLYGIKA